VKRRLQSALVIVIADAAPFDAVRRDFAPWSVERGIPFHITLLHPFAPRDELSKPLLADVRDFFATEARLEFSLARIACWPSVVYAVPEPDEPLVRCMHALRARFPQWPPYEGAHDTVIPHATLGIDVDADAVCVEIARRLAPHLPHRCSVQAATLLEEFTRDRWRENETFPLGR
jgi:2'-5' RNA ligase